MKSHRLITLLTDFGDRDVYVGVMKGVIAQIAPQSQVIDLTHQIPPQNLLAARFALLNAYPYFPQDAIHVAVVDPGVGSQRRGIALKLNRGYLVCPDNGLCSGILDSAISFAGTRSVIAAVELTNECYWRLPNPSNTFHGRDIFAPVAAHLANGVSFKELGQAIELESLVRLDLPSLEVNQSEIRGYIQDIDGFGNLITNIPGDLVTHKSWQIIIKNIEINSGKTYSNVIEGEVVSLIGSHGWVEIAINGGDAARQLKLTWQDRVQLIINN
ncbi:MAG: SAM-dependent chlorinase/fluorinase [Cyanobacteria bacterium P01_G01_bin.39]